MMKKFLIGIFIGTLGLTLAGCQVSFSSLSKDEAKTAAETFINENLMAPGTKATIKEITEEDGMYKIIVDAGTGKDITSYLSKDGKNFYPQVMNIEATKKQKEEATKAAQETQTKELATVEKSEKPEVELFVMSHCPFGTQIEKGLLPVLETIGSKIDFTLKFCDYAMHGEKELQEELLQYCVQKNEPEKLSEYLTCFLAEGKSDECVASTKLDEDTLENCIASTDKKFKVMKNFKANVGFKGQFPGFDIFKSDNEKYGIGGSPSFVVNGKQVQTGRDPKSLLQTVCAGFETQPEECKKELSSESPAPGFGFGGSTNAPAANCGG